jgi:hypothetical protein
LCARTIAEWASKQKRPINTKEDEDANAIYTCFAIELDQEVFSIPPVFGPAIEQGPEKAKP